MTPAERRSHTPQWVGVDQPVLGLQSTASSLPSPELHTVPTTMLTFIQLIVLLCWTTIGTADAEKLFHHRDHSDVQNLHQAEVISDESAAQVKIWNGGIKRLCLHVSRVWIFERNQSV